MERDALRVVHTMHYRNPEGQPRIGWFFVASHWQGEPRNAEPHKCAGLSWHPANKIAQALGQRARTLAPSAQ
ncbi:hypothetical protein [Streptomyces sp. NPDC097610]|uniref:hypothetical protein n=1 Tax=Streptomyces sp. NPDC097610 TaxID=3157227 RepID=UPI00331C95A0